jgi:DNA-binding transcriptional LysR family regulator
MIDELKRFLLVAQEGNLTRTAEKIFITQSALTQSIHRLEKNFQTKLFVQSGKRLQLTEDGKALVIIGDKILQLWNNAHDPEIRKTHIPTYSIGMFDNVAIRLGNFFQKSMQSSDYKLELTINSSNKLLTQLKLGTLDAVLCILSNTYQAPDHIELIQTYSEKLIPVSSKNFSGKISEIPFILYNRSSNTRLQIDELFARHSIRPTIYAESTSVTFMRELALLGCGVALLPENYIKSALATGNLKKQKMPIQWERTYALLAQKQFTLENHFIEDLKKTLENTKE